MTNPIEDLLRGLPEGAKELARARLRVAVTEELASRAEALGVSRSELAKRIGVTRSAVSQALSSSRNLSLNTLADMADDFLPDLPADAELAYDRDNLPVVLFADEWGQRNFTRRNEGVELSELPFERVKKK